jgi:hypothetical protein
MRVAQIEVIPLSSAIITGVPPVHAQVQSTVATAAALVHVRNSFKLTVRAPYKDAASLFGPNGERSWAGAHWNPKFLYPQSGEDVQGAVFTVAHGSHTSVWLNTVFDLDARHFQYVYFIPEVVVTQIDVDFQPLDEHNTEVQVVYTRTALTPEANENVQLLGEADRASGEHWQKAVNDYLKRAHRK